MESFLREHAPWLLGAAGAAAFSFHKLKKTWAADQRDIARIEAETYVVDMLRKELNSVVDQNKELAGEIVKLHQIVIDMRKQNDELTRSVEALTEQIEMKDLNSQLRISVAELTRELMVLRAKAGTP